MNKALEELQATKEEVVSLPGGVVIWGTDRAALNEMFVRHLDEMADALDDDAFLRDAVHYELSNHEYHISDTLRELGISLDDERTARIFRVALAESE